MKILLHYLQPYRPLVLLALLLATINQCFSLIDPIIFGKIIDEFGKHPHFFDTALTQPRDENDFIIGILWLLLASMGVAMVSRIAKAFQDYVVSIVIQKFGAKIFTDGLQHSMKLPYQDFEDQRSEIGRAHV